MKLSIIRSLLCGAFILTPALSFAQVRDHSAHKPALEHSASVDCGFNSLHEHSEKSAEVGLHHLAAMKEMVMMLEGKPDADGSSFDLDGFHLHLIEMDELARNTTVETEDLSGELHFAQMDHKGAVVEGMNHQGQAMATPADFLGKPEAHQNGAALPGQDAFGAIQEIIAILEADTATDWSKVDVSGLRAHLVSMNRLVLDSEVSEEEIDGGLEMTVSGQGRTLEAIQKMVSAHALTIDGVNGWAVSAETTAQGAILTVTSSETAERAHIRGLGFFGLMATGSHHQAHHLALARGTGMHTN